MRRRHSGWFSAIVTVFVIGFSSGSSPALAELVSRNILKDRPKLLLVLVMDQTRADYLTRFSYTLSFRRRRRTARWVVFNI